MAALGSCATAQDFPQSELFPAKANIVQHAACDTPRKNSPNVMGMASVGITSRPQAQGNSLLEGDGWAQTSHLQPSWSQNAPKVGGLVKAQNAPRRWLFRVSHVSHVSHLALEGPSIALGEVPNGIFLATLNLHVYQRAGPKRHVIWSGLGGSGILTLPGANGPMRAANASCQSAKGGEVTDPTKRRTTVVEPNWKG